MAPKFPDPYDAGRAKGWRITDANASDAPTRHDCDAVIIGSGAGGGITAEMLAKAGLSVAIVEAGPLRSSKHFKMLEWDAFRELYQDGAARQTGDGSITILQGRGVGGTTTINWMASFRPHAGVLGVWRDRFGLTDFTDAEMAPWFGEVERRLHIAPWGQEPNLNNSLLAKGGAAIGVKFETIARNQRDCHNLGYCGMGCPTNAKQSMLVTTIPAALDHGAVLFENLSALRLQHDQKRVTHLVCRSSQGREIAVHARYFVLAGGAIGSPALLLRSAAPDPHKRCGARTFLHPTITSAAVYEQRVEAYQGAPQSLYSDHFIKPPEQAGPISFKLEVAPLHPMLLAGGIWGDAESHRVRMQAFPHMQIAIALLRDGFHHDAPGGTVRLGADGNGVLDYPLTSYIFEGAKRAALAMAEIQFAAGARTVYPAHEHASQGFTTWADAKSAIAALTYERYRVPVLSAHVMGGCGMAASPEHGVVDGAGRHFQLENVSVHDGSVFPTGLGTNPQETIFGLSARASSTLATQLTGKAAPRLMAA